MFVGGMKDGTTEDDIRETFQDYGTIKEISVIKDKATGKMKILL
jgi:RNA recognition motif-containing protein